VFNLGPERARLKPERAQPLDVVDPAAHGHAVAAARELQQCRDERIQPPWYRVDVGEEGGHYELPLGGLFERRSYHAPDEEQRDDAPQHERAGP
jgi:hypothetical protein